MNTKKITISFIIPIYNESNIIERNILELIEFCQSKNIKAEIVLSENGSTDDSREIIKKLKYSRLKKLYVKDKGLGGAYRAGIKAATADIVYFTGMDFPFGYKNILDCLNHIDEYDLVLASKAHKKSLVAVNFKRRISSLVYQSLLRTILGMRTRDAQGCAMFRRKKILKYLNRCDSVGAFFQTQIALYAEKFGLPVIEIPVRYIKPRAGSKFSVIADGWQMFKQMVKERKKLAGLGNVKAVK